MENNTSRTLNTVRNIVWGYFGTFISMVIQFISRTIFIYTIGVYYLGINGLFTSILGMLSLTELGIGTAINFSLYKPVAEGNIEKIKSLMDLYKKSYRFIAIVIALIGLLIMPFLHFFINSDSIVPHIRLYYLIFLFNTVSSYFVSYKYGLVNADQKSYIINNVNSIFTIVTTIIQIIVLLLFKNYVVYLLSQTTVQLIQKLFLSVYIDYRYPFLKEKKAEKLPKNETQHIKKNVVSLMIHKLGEISIYQTDSIIISTFINTTLVGIISNYNLIITSVSTFVLIVFNSVTSSVGNLIAKESLERQKEIFDIYNFIGFWLYGVICICYFALFQPFIELWIGKQNQISEVALVLLVSGQYLVGKRLTVNNFKSAAGIFSQDKYISLIQGIINLTISLLLVKYFGLVGVYVGTVISGLYANIARPIIVYREIFNTSAKEYFLKSSKYFFFVLFIGTVVKIIFCMTIKNMTWMTFILTAAICFVLVNLMFYFCFKNTVEFIGFSKRIELLFTKKRKRI